MGYSGTVLDKSTEAIIPLNSIFFSFAFHDLAMGKHIGVS